MNFEEFEKNIILNNTLRLKSGWEIITSKKDELKKYNINLENNYVTFNLEKINQDSLAVKKNITGIKFIYTSPEIFLLINNEQVKDKKFGFPKKLDSLFPINEFLFNVFDVIGIKLYKYNIIKDVIIENLDDIIKEIKNDKSYFIFLKKHKDDLLKYNDDELKKLRENFNSTLETFNKNCCKLIRRFNCSEINIETAHSEKKNLNEITKNTLEDIKTSIHCIQIRTHNIIKEYFIYNMRMEKLLFLEIFNFKTDEIKMEDFFYFIKLNYIYHAKKIEKLHKKIIDPAILLFNINNFIYRINLSYSTFYF